MKLSVYKIEPEKEYIDLSIMQSNFGRMGIRERREFTVSPAGYLWIWEVIGLDENVYSLLYDNIFVIDGSKEGALLPKSTFEVIVRYLS